MQADLHWEPAVRLPTRVRHGQRVLQHPVLRQTDLQAGRILTIVVMSIRIYIYCIRICKHYYTNITILLYYNITILLSLQYYYKLSKNRLVHLLHKELQYFYNRLTYFGHWGASKINFKYTFSKTKQKIVYFCINVVKPVSGSIWRKKSESGSE